jgi:hypothetical protein
MKPRIEYEEAVARATIFLIRELEHASDAEQLERLLPKKCKEAIEQADKNQEEAWSICREVMRRPQFESLRLIVFNTYAKRMGWDTDKPMTVTGRSYIIDCKCPCANLEESCSAPTVTMN